jgi:hypothetical protein
MLAGGDVAIQWKLIFARGKAALQEEFGGILRAFGLSTAIGVFIPVTIRVLIRVAIGGSRMQHRQGRWS